MLKDIAKKPETVSTIVSEMKILFDVFEPQSKIRKFELKTPETKRLTDIDDIVAVHMIVDWLDADHIAGGTKPKDSALRTVMNHLVSDPGEESPDKYVKGHLLNENLGGKGETDNLFPITGKANSQHLHSTEKIVKKWVGVENTGSKKPPTQWVWYEVKVDNIKENFPVKGKKDPENKDPANFLNCIFYCRAVLKDESGNEMDSFVSVVPSEHTFRYDAKVFKMS